MENNFNGFEENNSDDGGGWGVLGIVIAVFSIFITIVLVLLRTGKLNGFISRVSQNNPRLGNFLNGAADRVGAPGGNTPAGTPGSRRGGPTAPTQASIAADAEQSMIDQILTALGADADMILASVGVDVAAELARNQKAIAKFIMKRGAKTPATKLILKKGASKILKGTFVGRMRGVFGRLTTKAAASLGLRWARYAARSGMTIAQITAKLSARLGAAVAAKVVAKMAAIQAAKASSRLATSASLGPIGVLYDAVTIVGLALDVTNTGNFAQMIQTSDLLDLKKDIDREVQNVNIACTTIPPTADCPVEPEDEQLPLDEPDPDVEPKAGRYPSFYGPLDKEQSDDYEAFYDRLTDKVVEIVTTEPYTPRVQALFTQCNIEFGNIFAEVFREEGIDPTTVEIPEITDEQFSEIFLAFWTDEDSEYFYDLAFDALCLDAGGVSFTPGAGYDRQCTYRTEAECHDQAPWPPPEDDTVDYTYTEWRFKDWFGQFKNTDGSTTLDMGSIPQGGACIAASPGFHQLCDEDITTGEGPSARTARNTYIRNTGECVNSPELCAIKGRSYTESMHPSSMAYLTDHSLPSCYMSDDMRACENIIGTTVCTAIASGADALGAQYLADINISTGNAVTDVLADQAEGLAAAIGGNYDTIREATQQAFAVMSGGQQTYAQIESGLQDVVAASSDNLNNLADRASEGSVTAALALAPAAIVSVGALAVASLGAAFSALDTAVHLSMNQNWPDPVWCSQPRCRYGEYLNSGGQDWRSCTILNCVCQSGNITNNMCCPKFHTGSMVNGQAICTPNPYPDWWNTFVAGSCVRCHDAPVGQMRGVNCQIVPGHYEDSWPNISRWYDDEAGWVEDWGDPVPVWWPEYTWCEYYVQDTQVVCDTPVTVMPRDPRDGFATRQDYCNSGMTAQENADAEAAAAAAMQWQVDYENRLAEQEAALSQPDVPVNYFFGYD